MEDILDTVFEAVEDSGLGRGSVRFVYLFGSYTENPETARDIDVCLSVDTEDSQNIEYKLKGRVPEDIDISIFENLPLQVKNQVFSGELLYSRDDSVYDTAFETFRDYERFEPFYKEAIGT